VYLPVLVGDGGGAAAAPTAALPWFVPLIGLTAVVGLGFKRRSWLSFLRDNK
jgi:hypothetical protein